MKRSPVLLIGTIVTLIGLLLVFWNPFKVIQWKISDLFFRGRGASPDITIIAIDEKSLSPEANLGRFKDWPRTYYAQLLRTINPHKPAAVAFDLDFKEASRGMSDLRLKQLLRAYEGSIPYELLKSFEIDHPDDRDFQKAIDESGPVVLVSSFDFAGGSAMPIFSGKNVSVGFINFMPDRDSVLRRFTPWISKEIIFGGAAANAFWGNTGEDEPEFVVNGTENPLASKPLLINFAAKPNSFYTLSFVDVLAGNYQPSDIAGKLVFVGGTARILQDLVKTPTSGNPMPGVEVNANITQQILENKLLREQSVWMVVFTVIIFAFAGARLMLRFSLRAFFILFAAVLFLFPAYAFSRYQFGTAVNVVYPEAVWIFTAIGALAYRYQTEFRAKREIKKAFAHYVSPVVVDELANHPEMLRLGGKRETISVMFSDIVGFTTLSEKLSPEDTVALLNDYLTSMTEVIFAYHGTLDKYQGDAIMALFGAPLNDEHHPVNVCMAALDMRKALFALHEKWNRIPELPFKEDITHLDFRVGIATGQAIVGNVGSETRFDYTAIGDIVNLGSRLESINRKYGTRVIVNKETFTAVTENHNPFLFRKLDTVRVKGKKQATEIFEVVCLRETANDAVKAMLDDFENGRILYADRNFAGAKQYFEAAIVKVPDDGPSQIYKNRCDFYIRKPPSMDWSPVVDLAEK